MADGHEGQLAFDFDEIARQDARRRVGDWSGAPLRFTTDYYPPAALDEAFAHWCFLNTHFDSYARSHMWHRSIAFGDTVVVGDGEHTGASFTAELRPAPGAEGPGGLLGQMICEPCQWHAIGAGENLTVEAWHDHAFPGWRDLPVIPSSVGVRSEKGLSKLARAWIDEHYPAGMRMPGAPIVTERSAHGTRHVPNASPWGGFDLSSTALHPTPKRAAPATVRRRVPGAPETTPLPPARRHTHPGPRL